MENIITTQSITLKCPGHVHHYILRWMVENKITGMYFKLHSDGYIITFRLEIPNPEYLTIVTLKFNEYKQ